MLTVEERRNKKKLDYAAYKEAQDDQSGGDEEPIDVSDSDHAEGTQIEDETDESEMEFESGISSGEDETDEKQKQLEDWQEKVASMDDRDLILTQAKFNLFDTDNDGQISVSEMIAAYGSKTFQNMAKSVQNFELYDIEKTKSLSIEEFRYWCVDSDGEWAVAPVENQMVKTSRPDTDEAVYYKTVLGTWRRDGRKNYFIIDSTGVEIQVTGSYLQNRWVQVQAYLGASSDEELYTDSGVDAEQFDAMNGGKMLRPPGDLTRLLANMSDDWASSEDELNFAAEEDFDFAESSAIDTKSSSSIGFAESSAIDAKTSSGLDFAESSAIETDSANEMSDGLDFAVSSDVKSSSDLEFAEASAVEDDKSQTSSLDFASSSDYD